MRFDLSLFLTVLLYFLNRQYLWNRFFLDELSQKKKEGSTYDFSWLSQVGEYGKMLSLEVKMIARNKRPRTTAMMSVLFILYGLIIYKQTEKPLPEFIFVFGGMFMTGVFGMMYGQFFPAWHSRYYPLLMAQNVKMKQILTVRIFSDGSYQCSFLSAFTGLYVHFAKSSLYTSGSNVIQRRSKYLGYFCAGAQ